MLHGYALVACGRAKSNTRSPRRLTIAGLPVSCGDEAHVAFAAVASRQVQAVAALTQVAVLRTLVGVCSRTQSDTIAPQTPPRVSI